MIATASAPTRRASPAAVTGGAASVTSVSREAGSTAGGTALTITGTSFSGSPSVTFGGTAATSVVVVNSTTITCVVPAHAAGVVDVAVVSATLASGFEYLSAPSTTFATHDFEDGTDGAFTTEGDITFSTDFAHTGTKSAKCSCTTGESQASLRMTLSDNPFLLSPGIYVRWYQLVTAATKTNAQAGQIKLHLTRPSDNSAAYLAFGIGGEFGSNSAGDLCLQRDSDTVDIGDSVYALPTEQWVEFQIYMKRNAGASSGDVRLWINGVEYLNVSHAAYGINTAGTAHQPKVGVVYAQNHTGTVVVYIDNYAVADGFIDPVS